MCANNDGMETHNQNIGVLFSRWQRKRGMRESGIPPSSHPPHPPLTPSRAPRCRMALCVHETSGFQGKERVPKGEKARDGELGVEGEGGASFISQCTQRTGHLIYIEPHGSSFTGIRCGF